MSRERAIHRMCPQSEHCRVCPKASTEYGMHTELTSKPDSTTEQKHSADSDLGCFPFFLYLLACLILALFIDPILWGAGSGGQASGVVLLLALVLGALPTIFIVAGLWERNVARSVLVATMLMTVVYIVGVFSPVLATLPANWEIGRFWLQLIRPATFAFNFPLLVLCGAAPIWAIRSYFGVYLSRHTARPQPTLSLEHLLLWTAVFACVLFYLRVPMQQLRLSFWDLLGFLPGQLLVAAGTSVVIVLPAVRFAFDEREFRWRWPALFLIGLISFGLLSILVNLGLSRWLRFSLSSNNILFFTCLANGMFCIGLWTLRSSGLRWKHFSVAIDSPEYEQQTRRDRISDRLWTSGYLVIAMLTGAVTSYLADANFAKITELVALRKQYLERGEDVAIEKANIRGLRLKSLQHEKLPPDFFEHGIKLVLKNSDVTDEDLELLSKIQSKFFRSLDLSHTQCTDDAFKHIAKLKSLSSLNLSGTKITMSGLSAFLDQHRNITSLTLEDMSIDDEQFKQIYKPWIRDWRLAGNQLTDTAVKPIWDNPEVSNLDISRNPVSTSVFTNNVAPRTFRFQLVADDAPLNDSGLFTLVRSGLLSILELGKSQVTPAGLEFALSNKCYVRLFPGSFTEEQLSTIDPITDSLVLHGLKTRCQFLTTWSNTPKVLDLSGTLLDDQVLAELAQQNRQTTVIRINGCPITDAAIPALNQLQPKHLDIRQTAITFEGLCKFNSSDVSLAIEHDQFTVDEIRMLNKRFFEVILVTDRFDSE